MRKRKCFGIITAFLLVASLVVSLVAGACAPAAPTGEGDCSDVEAKLSAEEKKTDALEDEVSDLEKEIAALKKPAEVQQWEPACFTGAGITWDGLVYVCDIITEMSDGLITATATAPGAVCPVEEQLDAVCMGNTEAMLVYAGYYEGKIPIAGAGEPNCFYSPLTVGELWYFYEVYEGGRLMELFQEEYSKYGDVQRVANQYTKADCVICSKVPIYSLDELEGVKFRTSETIADVLSSFGAGTVWSPGPEIYTMLATGAVDACTYDNADTMVSMSMHEVTDYWVAKPLLAGAGVYTFIVNGTIWRELPDDLKGIVEGACEAANGRNIWAAENLIGIAWNFVEDYGIEKIEWSDEDCMAVTEKYSEVMSGKYGADPACAEMLDMLQQFMVERGYLTE